MPSTSFYRRLAELALRLSRSTENRNAAAPLISIAGDMAEKAERVVDSPPISPFEAQEEDQRS